MSLFNKLFKFLATLIMAINAEASTMDYCPIQPTWSNVYSGSPQVSADITEIDGNTFMLQGNVEILATEHVIKANEANILKDSMDYSGFAKKGSFSNDRIKLSFDDLTIQDSGAEISATNGIMQINGNPLSLTFKTMEKVDDAIELQEVVMSSCINNPAGWQINGRKIEIFENGRGNIYGMQLNIFDHTIMQLPWTPFAASTERLSGFLEPKIQFGSDGVDLSIPYFIVLSDSSDLTIAPRNLASRGMGFESNYRFKTLKHDIEVDGLFLNKDKRLKKLPSLVDKRWSGGIKGNGSIAVIDYEVNWAKASDFLVLQNIPSFVSNIAMNRAPYLLQNVGIVYKNNDLSFALRTEDSQILDPLISRAIAKKPEFEINYVNSWNLIEFNLKALHSNFDVTNQPIHNLEDPTESRRIDRNYIKTELITFQHIHNWDLEIAYSSTLRKYNSSDVTTPENTSINSFSLHASSFLQNQKKNVTLKPFFAFKNTGYDEYGNILMLDDQTRNLYAYDILSDPLFTGKDISLDEQSFIAGFEVFTEERPLLFHGKFAIKKDLEESKLLSRHFIDLTQPKEQLLTDMSWSNGNTFLQLALNYDISESQVRNGELAFQQIIGENIFKIAQHKQNLSNGLSMSPVDFRELSVISTLGGGFQAFLYNSKDIITNKNMDSYVGIGYENCCVVWRILARDKRLIDLDLTSLDDSMIPEDQWKEMISFQNKSRITFEIELKGLMNPSKRIQRLLQYFQE